MTQPASLLPIDALRAAFGAHLQVNPSLAGYTTARAGGTADALLTASSANELEEMAQRLWALGINFTLLGYGSNVLVSDDGLRGVVLLNRARAIQIDEGSPQEGREPSVWAESGALIGTIARQAALKGLSGFEWAAAVPGTLGGAVYGNAGAYGGDMNGSLLLAEILHPTGKEIWPVERMQYTYRSSTLKRERKQAVVLSARLKLAQSDPAKVKEKMDGFTAHRRSTQPPGASLGSMFKNPPGDYAGRLIEAAGLKGTRIGDAEISAVHANFFINHGQASAADIGQLIHLAQKTVVHKFGVRLDLEVELIGDWSNIIEETTSEGA
ncbi:MAG: UDP-N-acetylmuramate dehydrogenase [Anaerolineaceae bacterium]|nr:UDP-N-acetylmuramate dehydrogenase [Anaerolineaceae bacterium]